MFLFSQKVQKQMNLHSHKSTNCFYARSKIHRFKSSKHKRRKGDFTVNDEQGLGIKADYIIVATGANKSDIKELEDFVIPHELMPKPNKFCFKHHGRQIIKEEFTQQDLLQVLRLW